jgi:hypothetical protein
MVRAVPRRDLRVAAQLQRSATPHTSSFSALRRVSAALPVQVPHDAGRSAWYRSEAVRSRSATQPQQARNSASAGRVRSAGVFAAFNISEAVCLVRISEGLSAPSRRSVQSLGSFADEPLRDPAHRQGDEFLISGTNLSIGRRYLLKTQGREARDEIDIFDPIRAAALSLMRWFPPTRVATGFALKPECRAGCPASPSAPRSRSSIQTEWLRVGATDTRCRPLMTVAVFETARSVSEAAPHFAQTTIPRSMKSRHSTPAASPSTSGALSRLLQRRRQYRRAHSTCATRVT